MQDICSMCGVVVWILTVVVTLHEFEPGGQYTRFYIQHTTQVKLAKHLHTNEVEWSRRGGRRERGRGGRREGGGGGRREGEGREKGEGEGDKARGNTSVNTYRNTLRSIFQLSPAKRNYTS